LLKRLVIGLVVPLGLLALADRGLAMYAGNATGHQIRLREGLREDAEVTFRGFPFTTQAIRGRFREVDVTVRDLERNDLVIDRIDADLRNVEVDLGDALNGRVRAVPVESGTATLRLTYGDVNTWLTSRPGNVRIVVREGRPYVVSSFGVPNVGQIDVEGTPSVRVTKTSVTVSVTGVHPVTGSTTLNDALARTAGARASFTLSLDGLPFGIALTGAELTADALVVDATATGLILEV
jgi:hypothetical protein